jgi:tape measure domain-containing protein
MALIDSNEVQLRISTKAEGQGEVDGLSNSISDLEKDFQAVGEAARNSGAKQAEAAQRLKAAKAAQDEVKIALQSAKNEYKFLADRAKESGAAQSLFAQQAAQAKQRVADLKTELLVASGNTRMLGKEYTGAAAETRRLAAEQQRLGQELRSTTADAGKASTGLGGLAESAKNLAKAYVGIETARQFLDANIAIESLDRSLTQIMGSSQAAADEIEWLRQTTNKLGIETQAAARAYVSLAASAKGTMMEGENTRRIFEAVAGSMAKLGKSSADTEGALQAISQMMGKGVVSMEEMRQQLAERLPGAMQAAADASGMTVAELSAMISTGNVLAEDMLPKLAAGLEKMYGTGAEVQGTISAWNRLKNAIAETFQFVGQSGVMTGLAAILGQVAIAVRGLTGAFDLLGKIIGITFAAIATFDFKRPIESLKNWRLAVVEAGDEIQKKMDAATGSTDKAGAAQGKLADDTKAAADAAASSEPGWLAVVNAYGKVATAAESASAQAVKSAAAREEEGKAALGLANALGTEEEKRQTAMTVAMQSAETLQTLANARQHEADIAKAQAEALAAVAAAEGVVSEAKRVAIQTANEKAIALQSEADKSNAAALAAQQRAAALETESLALQDNAARTLELRDASEKAASALEQMRAARAAGIATAQELADAEIKAAQAAALYRDALGDQVTAIRNAASEKQSLISIERAGIQLAIEQQRSILNVARARGDEYAALNAQIEIRKLEIKLSELVAKAKAAEAQASMMAAAAQRELLQASGQLTAAKEAELKAMEASARVKQVEAQIAAETARGMRELADATYSAGNAAAESVGGYDRLAGSLLNVAAAAEKASAAQSILDDKDVTGRTGPVNVRDMLYKQGASVEEAQAAEKYYNELYNRRAAKFLTGNLGNSTNAARQTNIQANEAIKESIALAKRELSTGQAVDLGTSVNDAIARNMARTQFNTQGLTPAGGEAAVRRAVQSAGNETFGRATTVNINLGGKTTAVNVNSQQDADALAGIFKLIESDARRA